MSTRELILLSPYRIPAQSSLTLGSDETAAFLNGLAALWHPAALAGAESPPRIDSPYDHEQPNAGRIYAVPESPPLILPDDWDERVRQAGAFAFRASPDREATVRNLKEALAGNADVSAHASLLDVPEHAAAAFMGIGFGFRMLESLFEAMEHEFVLSTTDFWQDVQQGVTALGAADAEAYRRHLQAAADRLLMAREVVYPVTIHLLDFSLLGDARPADSLPASFKLGLPLNIITAASVLERLATDEPGLMALLKERALADTVEVCGGPYLEREDTVFPLESQLWNLRKGLASYRALLDQDVRVFARKRFAAAPQTPLLLHAVGIRRAVLLAFDESVCPSYRVTVINWPSPDGKQVDAYVRMPHKADSPQTFFHWAYHLRKTIAEDHAATLGLVHADVLASPSYRDLLELSRFGPIFGQWTTLSRYLTEVLAGEYASSQSADEFHSDYLGDRTNAHLAAPVSEFGLRHRGRRRLDSIWTLAALYRGLAGRNDTTCVASRLTEVEDRFETTGELDDLDELEDQISTSLIDRLLGRAQGKNPGYLLLNPCSFTRRAALELEGYSGPIPVEGPVKSFQLDGQMARLVVEVPGLGFAWVPRGGNAGAPLPPIRMRLADARCVRNEFFEAEVDAVTGGLRALRDRRTQLNRIGQQLVYNPGSTMHVTAIQTQSQGPALGEIQSEGVLRDESGQVIARFRQRFRAWLGRPVLELRIEVIPEKPVMGYPWHAYFGARFAWRDERAALLRGVGGSGFSTTHTRPETSDYLEIRQGKQSTLLLPGGCPFHQRQGSRMLDVILEPEGETARVFELGLALDRDYPTQTALGMISPMMIRPVETGPPHVGAAGWLFHLDSPNLLLTGMRPDSHGGDAINARLLECHQFATQAELLCVRSPKRACLQDAMGSELHPAAADGDAVKFDVQPSDLVQLRVEFE